MVLRVHPSNFAMAGFTESPDPAELAALAHAHGALVVDDLGSGALLDTSAFGLAHEPTPRERLAAGADLVTFSGDKLVGGPQAGLLVGRGDLVARLRKDPLARAMRPDKATLAGVAATLGLYRAGRATAEIPVWRMIATPAGALRDRADALAARVDGASVVALRATVGGGSLPGETLPSFGLALAARSADRLLAALRAGEPASSGGSRTAGSSWTCGRSSRRSTTTWRQPSCERSRRRDRRRRDRRPHRPRQDDAAAGADRDRRRPPSRGAATGDDDRRRLRPPGAAGRRRPRLRRRARPRPAGGQHARRRGGDRRRAAGRRGRRRAPRPDPRARRAARRPGPAPRGRRDHEGRCGRRRRG